MTRLLPDNDPDCGWIGLLPPRASRPAVRGVQRADFAIVGAGFTGLSAALRLAESAPRSRIALLDAQRAGEGASARNSGFMVDSTLNDAGGGSAANADAWQSRYQLNRAGIALLEALVQRHAIDCEWDACGKFHAAADPRNFARLRSFAGFLAERGIAHRVCERDELAAALGTTHYALAVHTEGGILVQPGALARGLVEALPGNVALYEDSAVLRIEPGREITLHCAHGEVRAPSAIVAVNAFMPALGIQRNRVMPLTLTASLGRVLTPEEDAALGRPRPYGVLSVQPLGATLRLTTGRRIMVRNTAEAWPRIAMRRHELDARRALHEDGLRRRYPGLAGYRFESTWSGAVCVSRNSASVFERAAPNLWVVGCYNAGGIAKGALYGALAADDALGNDSATLQQVLALAGPTRMPPEPLRTLGARLRMAWRRRAGASEA